MHSPTISIVCIVLLVSGSKAYNKKTEETIKTNEEIIAYINKNSVTKWKAALPQPGQFQWHIRDQPVEVNIPPAATTPYGDAATQMDTNDLPRHYDLRTVWGNCTSVVTIRDQSQCDSCYAVSGASVLGDRFCIQSGGRHNVMLSAGDLISCCGVCGSNYGDGCQAGTSRGVWLFFVEVGIVSGGQYGSDVGCLPYPLPPCNGTDKEPHSCKKGVFSAPPCRKTCTNPDYDRSYRQDKHLAEYYYAAGQNATDIQKELYLRGSVQSGMLIFKDFNFYKEGIYVHTYGEKHNGVHSIKLIGWGEENGVDYWIVANSWGKNWGEEGTFRIRRGTDEVKIEFFAIAGKPLFESVAEPAERRLLHLPVKHNKATETPKAKGGSKGNRPSVWTIIGSVAGLLAVSLWTQQL